MPGTYSIQINGLDKLQVAFKQAPEIVEPILQQAIERSKGILDETRINPSYIPWVTGELARRWTTSYGHFSLMTKPDVVYARAVQFGLPPSPGRFVPAIGKRLKNGPNIGEWPGFAGRHYMEVIKSVAEPLIQVEFEVALQKITTALTQ